MTTRIKTNPAAMADAASRGLGNRIPHPLLREAGNQILMSLDRPVNHPGGAITQGNTPSGTQFPLIAGGTLDVLAATAATFQRQADGSILVPGTGNSGANALRFGAAGAWDMSGAPIEFVDIIWLKLPAAGYLTGDYLTALRYSSDASTVNAQTFFDLGIGGLTPRFTVKGCTATSPVPIAPGQKVQIAGHFKPGEKVHLYLNGVKVQEAAGTKPSTLTPAAAAFLEIPNSMKAYVYAVTHLAIAQALAFEQAIPGIPPDWVRDAAAYIKHDYLVRTGAHAGAPGFALP